MISSCSDERGPNLESSPVRMPYRSKNCPKASDG
jgi:hypothetical protein